MRAWQRAATESCTSRTACYNRAEWWSRGVPRIYFPDYSITLLTAPSHLQLELRTESPEVFPCLLKMLTELRAPLSMHPLGSKRPRQRGNLPGKLRQRTRSN